MRDGSALTLHGICYLRVNLGGCLRRLIERFILTLVELSGMWFKTMGSTTMNDAFLKQGAEPDNAYYIQN
jgi:hypothetical protein